MPIHRAQLHLQLQGVARRSLLVVAVQLGDSGGVEVLFVQCVEGGVLARLHAGPRPFHSTLERASGEVCAPSFFSAGSSRLSVGASNARK